MIRKTEKKRNRIAEGLEATHFTYAHVSWARISLMAPLNYKGTGNMPGKKGEPDVIEPE